MSVYAGPEIVNSGLVLALDAGNTKSYPGSGTTWTDLSGNGNHATLYNSPTWSSTNGGTFTFNGTNQYAQCPAGFANFTGGITIFAICNMGTANGTGWERIIDFGSGAPSNNILFTRNWTTDNLTFEFYNATTTSGIITITSGIVNSQIQCYAATANGVNITLYRNGQSIGSVADTDLPPNVSRSLCYIGRSNWAADAYFETTMNVLMMYNRGLSAAEIQQNFYALRGRFGI